MIKKRLPQLIVALALILLYFNLAFADGQARQIAVDGRSVNVVMDGQGQPILFVHGWLGNTSAWENQFDFFANFYQVVAFDLTGFGASDKPNVDEIEYDHALWDADIEAIIEELELKDVILVGHSSGSSTVVSYAASHPQDVAKIVLISSIPMSPSETTREQGADFSNFVAGDFDAFVQVMVAGVFSEAGTEMHRAALDEVMHLSTPEIAVESYWNYIEPDRTPLLAQIPVPALVVHGAADVNIPVAVSQAIADAVGDAEMHVVAGKGHAPHITSPDLFNVLMYQFLKN